MSASGRPPDSESGNLGSNPNDPAILFSHEAYNKNMETIQESVDRLCVEADKVTFEVLHRIAGLATGNEVVVIPVE